MKNLVKDFLFNPRFNIFTPVNITDNIKLVFENNLEVKGQSFGFPKSVSGEVVFNTAMTGYPESLTDPSYQGQILILTYPLIGNYGVPSYEYDNSILKNFESERIHVSGLVISDYVCLLRLFARRAL